MGATEVDGGGEISEEGQVGWGGRGVSQWTEREREVPMARCVRVDEVVWAGLFRFMEWAGPSSCFFF